jgi:Leucine-rich repeat (LRR) protein
MAEYNWEVFICHASEDKEAVARPLANHLAALGINVWLDESEIHLGDSLRIKIDAGLAQSRFGVDILSPNFFSKNWTKSELDGLIAREATGTKVVLPIWHKLRYEEVRNQSPILAGRLGISTERGLANVAKAILSAIENSGPRDRRASPIFAGRLTKKLLLELPDGTFLLGNSYNPDLTPKIAEPIPPISLRDDFWKRLSKEGGTKTKVYVFRDAASYRAHMAARDIYEPKDTTLLRNRASDHLPSDFDIEIVRALIAAGKSPPIAWRPFITALSFEDGKYHFDSLDGLEGLDRLERLDLYDIEPRNIDALVSLKSLRWLYLSDSVSRDISALATLNNLEYLDINMSRVQDIEPLSGLTHLEHLHLFCRNLRDISPLGKLQGLKSLDLSMTQVRDISPLRSARKLQTLVLMSTPVEDISALADLCNLQNLCLWKTDVVDLSPLASLNELRTLDIDETNVELIGALKGLNKLRFLGARDTNIQDLQTLADLPDLEISLQNRPYTGPAKIDLSEEWQVWYWTRHLSVDKDQLQSLIAKYGNSAAVIHRLLLIPSQ